MKPLDPRLLRYAKAARSYIFLITATGIITSVLVVVQTFLIAGALTPIVDHRAAVAEVAPYLWGLLAVLALRCLITIITQSQAHKAATAAIAQLRRQVLTRASQLGPRWLADNGISTVVLTTRGLEDLAPYFVAYLPQLLLSVTVTPIVLAVIAYLDLLSAVAAIIAIALIPIFMILIGRFTQEFSNRRLATMQRLGAQLLDLIAGLPTLQALGRERGPEAQVAAIGKRYNRTTMATLRVAFLSGAVLEFVATLAVAIVAVEVGFRLVYGNMDLFTGLVVITLAPEVYLPLREVGKQFHASTDGITAANKAFAILEQTPPTVGTTPCPDLRLANIKFTNLAIAARAAWAPADLSAEVAPGSVAVLDGPSGAGKSTTVMALLGMQEYQRGTITIDGIDLALIDPQTLWSQVTWVAQTPVISPPVMAAHEVATVADYLGTDPTNPDPRVVAAAQLTGLAQMLEDGPAAGAGWGRQLAEGGIGLSVGQRQRLTLTKAICTDRQVVILDEPTAHLDAGLEQQFAATIQALAEAGKTVILIAHRAPIKRLATTIIPVTTRPFTAVEAATYGQATGGAEAGAASDMPGVLALLDQEAKR